MFWRKANPVAHESELVRRAREQFGAGEPENALQTLIQAFSEQPEDRAGYALAAQVIEALGATQEAELFRQAVQSEPVQALFDLGLHFAGAEHDELAEAFLGRAFELTRNPFAATHLAKIKRQNFQMEAAAQLLQQAQEPRPYWAQAELALTELLLSRPEAARQLPHEYAHLDTDEQQVFAEIQQQNDATLRRFEAVGQPQVHIRDWHFIQYGAAILSYMGLQEGEGAFEVAGGRYVYQSGGEEEVRCVLHRLRLFLQEVGHVPPAVWACPDKDSEVLGRALATLLERPFVAGERPQENVLVVAADSRLLLQSEQDVEELTTVRPGQVVFAYDLNWVDAGGVTPDIAGLLTQMYVFPWAGGQMRVNTDDPENPRVESSEADERPAEIIAAELVRVAPAESDPDFAETLAFYRPLRPLLTLNQPGVRRLPFSRESPVPGAYFGAPGMVQGEEADA